MSRCDGLVVGNYWRGIDNVVVLNRKLGNIHVRCTLVTFPTPDVLFPLKVHTKTDLMDKINFIMMIATCMFLQNNCESLTE